MYFVFRALSRGTSAAKTSEDFSCAPAESAGTSVDLPYVYPVEGGGNTK